MANIGSGLGMLGGAVSDLFGSSGSSQAAGAYGKAAQIAEFNKALTLRSTAIQEKQQDIQTYKVLGTEAADVAGAGFTSGGTAGDLMRASAQQAALSKQLIQNQGEITAQGFEEQAAAYTGQQQAAQTQSKGQAAGGILQGLGAVASVVGWVICTELVAQGLMPRRYWAHGSKVFAAYPQMVKDGYHAWAVPVVRHMRRYPYGRVVKLMKVLFGARAENIAAHAGVPGARKRWAGAAVTAVLWPLCYGIGLGVRVLNIKPDWEKLYAEH